jgi:hypothetical protein
MTEIDKKQQAEREEFTNEPIETDYNAHKDNPGPPIEAVVEEDKKGAGQMMKWIIPILVIALLLVYFFIVKKN